MNGVEPDVRAEATAGAETTAGADIPIYLDTSALLPYYRAEPSSDSVEAFLQGVGRPIVLSRLADLEMTSALNRLVRMGELREPDILLIEHAYLDDLREGRFDLVPVPTRAYADARSWMREYQRDLRTLDALHLAACRLLGAVMITCDRRLHEAAVELGVECRLLH